jgi:hypothetical protein
LDLVSNAEYLCKWSALRNGARSHGAGETYLSHVDVGTVGVDVGVVRPEHGCIDAISLHDVVADVTILDNVNLLAILVGGAEAEFLSEMSRAS